MNNDNGCVFLQETALRAIIFFLKVENKIKPVLCQILRISYKVKWIR